MNRTTLIGTVLVVAGLIGAGVWLTGADATKISNVKDKLGAALETNDQVKKPVPPPAVTAAEVKERAFVETVVVTGSIVARNEIVVAPEVEGLRIVKLNADEGDHVEAGDTLAVLENKALTYQLEQRTAALQRATAAIEQAKQQIVEAKARTREAEDSLKRAEPLRKKKYIAESVVDQRRAAAISAKAQVASAEEGLRVAIANKSEIEAQQRELAWRASRAEVKAPVAGLISKRNARVGEIAIGANAFTDQPMFRMIEKGEVELDGEVAETEIGKLEAGQDAVVRVTGVGEVPGKVRLVSPEVDKTTRLGSVRIFLGANPRVKLGSFGHGLVSTRTSTGLSVPLSSVMYTDVGASVLVIENGRAKLRAIKKGLVADGYQEVLDGLQAGDVVVAKSGTFLRDGDEVRAMVPQPRISEATR